MPVFYSITSYNIKSDEISENLFMTRRIWICKPLFIAILFLNKPTVPKYEYAFTTP